MTSLSSRLLSRGAAVTAVVLTTTCLAAVSAPAGAVSGTLSYDCTTASMPGTHVFTAVIDTDAPATLGSGLSAPIKTTSTVTVPESVADALRTATVSYVSGSAEATGTVDGANRQTTLAIPNTTVPPDGTTMQVVGTGSSGSIKAGAAGTTILLGAGNFTATLTGYTSAGAPVGLPYTFTCTLQPGQNLLVDSVAVVPAPTTTTITVQNAPVEYGDAPTVLAAVAAPGVNTKPAGKIAFTYAGTTVTVDAKGGKAKATLSAALKMGANQVTAKFTPTDKNLAESQATKAFTVVKGSTTTTASAVYRDARNRLVGKALVEAVHGTDVAGDVKFVLKRNGVKIRSAVDELNQFDKAKKVFKRIRKPGTYVLVAKYLGSATLKRSKDRVKLVI